MNDPVKVDLSRVHAALRLSTLGAELQADQKRATIAYDRSKTISKLVACSATGCALVIISIGVAIWLAKTRDGHQNNETQQLSRRMFDPSLPGDPIITGTIPANKVIASVNLFNSIDKSILKISNPYFLEVTAGHRYQTSNSEHWDYAWCYAIFSRDGLTYNVDLENRTIAAKNPLRATTAELLKLELKNEEIEKLRSTCPWRTR